MPNQNGTLRRAYLLLKHLNIEVINVTNVINTWMFLPKKPPIDKHFSIIKNLVVSSQKSSYRPTLIDVPILVIFHSISPSIDEHFSVT